MRDRAHLVTSLKRLVDGTWQLWCSCSRVFTAETVSKVTNLHADHIIGEHEKEVYGVDKE